MPERVLILKIDEKQRRPVDDDVVMEKPLEIRVNGESLSVTMRTPGDDFDLAVGLPRTERVIPEFNMTAVGFLRGGSMNIYSNPERIKN
jgi:FdhD protein